LHRFDTDYECDRRTDGRPDDGKDARSILLSRVKTGLLSIDRHSYATQFMITYVQQHLKRGNRRSKKQNVISIKQYSHTNISDVATKRTVSDFVDKTINIYRKKDTETNPPFSNSTRQSKNQENVLPHFTHVAQIENQYSNIHRTFSGTCLCINLIKRAWWFILSNALDKSNAQMLTVEPFLT